jgi:hypothetical protein
LRDFQALFQALCGRDFMIAKRGKCMLFLDDSSIGRPPLFGGLLPTPQ